MKEKLKELINKINLKQLPAFIKKDAELKNWIDSVEPDDIGYSEKAYRILHSSEYICNNGNTRKFISFNEGYRPYCGRTKECQCAKEEISKKLSGVKKSKDSIDKRKETLLEKYGVDNPGKLQKAIIARKEFYNNQELVSKSQEKYKETMLEKYGVDNGLKLDFVKEMKSIPHSEERIQKRIDTFNKNYDRSKNIERGYLVVKKRFSDHNITMHTKLEDYDGYFSYPYLSLECNVCNHTWEQRYMSGYYQYCPVCKPETEKTYVSNQETEVVNFIKENYSGNIITSDRSIINPFEIDILLPELKLGIEYCGIYWHSEKSSGRGFSYHQNKLNLMKSKGYDLITIFSDEWEGKRYQVENKLLNLLNVSNEKVFARKCSVKKVSRNSTIEFLNENHIQGAPNRLPLNYGLYFDDILVAVMCFSITNNKAELTRYATSIRVVGGASKILSSFLSENKVDSVFSFSDNRWSNGKMYESIGFTKESEVPPMQSYVEKYSFRYHKQAMSKYKFKDIIDIENKTEWEVMQELGYDRIWDCGKIKWKYEVSAKALEKRKNAKKKA